MNVNFSEKELEFLKQYAKVYQAEREKDSTNDPIVVVEVMKNQIVPEEYGDKNIYLLEQDGEYGEYETIGELNEFMGFDPEDIEELETLGELIIDDFRGKIQVTSIQVVETWEPVAYFLTRIEADKYCKYQRHNLNKPRVYTRYCGYSNNGDLQCLTKLLLKIGQEILESEE